MFLQGKLLRLFFGKYEFFFSFYFALINLLEDYKVGQQCTYGNQITWKSSMLKERKMNMNCPFSKVFLSADVKQVLREICFLFLLLQLTLLTLLPHSSLFLPNLTSFQSPLKSLNQLMKQQADVIKSIVKSVVKPMGKCGTGALNKRSNTQ